MLVLVIGSTGQLARSLRERQTANGLTVRSVGRPEVDLVAPETLQAAISAHRPAVVINAAAYTQVDKAEDETDVAHAINAHGPECLALVCRSLEVPIIHISTDYVFDGNKSESYTEVDTVSPLGAYGRSKYAGEVAVAANWDRHLIFRTSWVFSPFGHNFVRTMLRLATTRTELSVVDDQFGSPTSAIDLADVLLWVARQASSPAFCKWGTYHAAGTGHTTWCGLAREVFAVSRELGGPLADVHAIPSDAYLTPAKRPKNSRLDCRKLKQTFGVQLPAWQDSVRACVSRLLAAQRHEGIGS